MQGHVVRGGARRRLKGAALLAVLGWTSLLQAGCYSLAPREGTAVQPGTRVVATLTDQGSEAVASQMGPRIAIVEGTVGTTSPTEWELFVISSEKRDGIGQSWNGERVMVPVSAMATVREKKVDQNRSILAAGALAGAALLVASAFGGIFGGGGGGDPGPPPPPN